MNGQIQIIFCIILVIGLSIPLGKYIYKIINGETVLLSKIIEPIEKKIYQFIGIDAAKQMTAKSYIYSIITLSGLSIAFLMLLLMTQKFLPLNPQHVENLSLSLAFNTAVSYVTNTNWQAYTGETTLSYFSQMIGLTVQNFISPAVALSVCFALLRGFVLEKKATIGNLWKDMTRSILYIFLPLAFLFAVFLMSQGVVQSLGEYLHIISLDSGAPSLVPLGPAASQIAIKILGSNGGGFFGANAAFPFENPTPLSNILQIVMMLLIPAALCVSFGYAVKDKKQTRTVYLIMLSVYIVALGISYFGEMNALLQTTEMVGANLAGKEVMHGVSGSTLWAITTTAVSNGSFNAIHNSFSPIVTTMMMFLMQLGEIIFGGVGSGLYGMIGFILLTVFIVGLMVGRTPEYLRKKIEPAEIKMVCLMILMPPLITLIGTAIMLAMPSIFQNLENSGIHAFSQILYNASSLGNNNGSAFSGMALNQTGLNIIGAIMMLLTRFIPMLAVVQIASSLAGKKALPATNTGLSTTSGTFTFTTILIIIVIGALSFLPALVLGPIAEILTLS